MGVWISIYLFGNLGGSRLSCTNLWFQKQELPLYKKVCKLPHYTMGNSSLSTARVFLLKSYINDLNQVQNLISSMAWASRSIYLYEEYPTVSKNDLDDSASVQICSVKWSIHIQGLG